MHAGADGGLGGGCEVSLGMKKSGPIQGTRRR